MLKFPSSKKCESRDIANFVIKHPCGQGCDIWVGRLLGRDESLDPTNLLSVNIAMEMLGKTRLSIALLHNFATKSYEGIVRGAMWLHYDSVVLLEDLICQNPHLNIQIIQGFSKRTWFQFATIESASMKLLS